MTLNLSIAYTKKLKITRVGTIVARLKKKVLKEAGVVHDIKSQ